MGELRKDYILDRWVIISPKRGLRPHEFKEESKVVEGTCYFCPGNEHMTPPEIARRSGSNNQWVIRCFPNKFNAVDLSFPKAYGTHEVIVETPVHGQRLSELSVEHLEKVLEMYAERTSKLSENKKLKYVLIFKNEGPAAGASLAHSHTQLVSMDRVPMLVRYEIAAARKAGGNAAKGNCAYCRVWKNEKKAKTRVIYENEYAIVFAPYAPRFTFESWLFVKPHRGSLGEMSEKELHAVADALKHVLVKMDTLLGNPDYNYYLHTAPLRKKDGDLHFHIEICPRLGIWAGFEFGANSFLNSMAPEVAAKALKKA